MESRSIQLTADQIMRWVIFVLLYPTIQCQDNLEIVSKTRTSHLQTYGGYVDVVVMHVEIPKETAFAAFKFVADQTQASIFACKPQKVSLYMKHKSLPVINPDRSKFPSSFKNITRSKYFYLELKSDKSVKYINLTSPDPGCYFISAFLPYVNPGDEEIRPQGFSSKCYVFIETTLYVKRRPSGEQIIEEMTYEVGGFTNQSLLYTFYVPEVVNHATLILQDIRFAETAQRLIVRLQSRSIPSEDNMIKGEIVDQTFNESSLVIPFNTQSDNWHFVEYTFEGHYNETADSKSTLKFTLKYFYEKPTDENDTALWKIFNSDNITQVTKYQQYDLIREASTESFSYSYELRQKFSISSTVSVNLTSDQFTVLQFKLRQHTDIGGTLQFILSFKPRLNKQKGIIELEPEDHQIIACIRPEAPEIPTWPHYCIHDEDKIAAPLILNKTTDNSSIMIPYPEHGVWYATFKLFCGECVPCDCPNECQKEFSACVMGCQENCEGRTTCNACSMDCKTEVVHRQRCAKCDCDGPCRRTKKICNSSVIFDITSMACANDCGRNGRCMFMVCDGVVYATCVCSNNYRGWDCSDNSLATPYYMIVLELLLLVLSNLMFLPTVYVAYRRQYYVEAIVYFAICFFSTFYHACDAGENIISFCITRLAALQFADFYCALLAIWVTLIAIADLPTYWPTICYISGAIVLSFTTSINKTAFWGFMIPVVAGLIVIAVNWFLKWRKMRRLFLNKRYVCVYLPIGGIVVTSGLAIFVFLETTNNYKYLHSMWHMIMAVSVIILLPRPDTFQPDTVL